MCDRPPGQFLLGRRWLLKVAINENDINHHDGSGQPVSHAPRLATDAKDKPFIDLVCGMKVRANPGKTVDYEVTAYHFCSMGCVTKFKTDP